MGKIATFGEKARKIVSGLKFSYQRENGSELGKVDFGVLTVAMMVAALDGVIEPPELRAFSKLADQCRVSEGEKAAYYNAALHSAGYMLLVSRSGASQTAIVQAFVAEAEKVLPAGVAGGKGEDIRRALVIWITMGQSDGQFSGIERACIRTFCARVADIMKRRRDCRRERLWTGLCPGMRTADGGSRRQVKDLEIASEADWMARAEELAVGGDLAAIRRSIVRG